jgi:hypothetical protein
MVGILDDIGSAWGNFWEPKTVPAGAGYDPEVLGNARAQAIGNLGGNLLALSQGGLSPEARAGLLTKVGSAPLTYQQALLAGIEGKLHAATAAKTEQEVAAQKASDAQFADLIQQAKLRGAGGAVAGVPGAGGAPGTAGATGTGTPVAGDIGGYARTALAALKKPESGGDPGNVNQYGYSGLYQIGTGLANSAGLYQPAQDEAVSDSKGRAVNAWRGQWTIPGFEPMTHQQFLKNPQAQQAAGEAAMAHNWKEIVGQGLDKYVGQTIGNVTITPQGLLQGAWLGGVGGLKSWLSGTGDPTDANKTPVSRWAALQPPPGFNATATDAGGAQPVPAGGGGTGGQGGAGGAGTGGGGTVVGGVPIGGNAPPRFSLQNLSVEQLTMLSRLPRAEAQKWILDQSTKDEPFILTAEQVAAVPNLPPGTYKYSRAGGLTKVSDAPSRYMTPEEVKARPNLNPNMEYQIDGMNNVKQVGERPAVELTVEEKKARSIDPTAVVYRKADGTITRATEGLTRWMTPAELAAAHYAPDAKVLIKPDGNIDERDKGTNPFAAMTEADAHSTLIKYAPQVEAKTLDPKSPEGRRYQAAYDMVTRGTMVQQARDDGSKVQVYQPKPTSYPDLGAGAGAKQPGEGVQTEAPRAPTESQAKAMFYLNSMKSAEEDLDRLAASGKLPTGWRNTVVNNTPTAFGNWLLTPEGRQYKQAQEVWAEAYIRTVSGAVFGPGEEEKAANAFFPRPNDDAVTIAQKARTRANIQKGMGLMAGTQGVAAVAGDANKPSPKSQLEQIQTRLANHSITWDEAVHLADKHTKGLSEFLTRPGQ